MICTYCGSIIPPKKPPPGARCSYCGSPMQRENHETMRLAAEAFALFRLRQMVALWSQEGLIAAENAAEIQRRLAPVQQVPELVQHVWQPPAPEPEQGAPLHHEPELPAAIGGLDAIAPLAALDYEPPAPSAPKAPGKWETEVRPLLYENIGWFLGTLLVLAGSVYGVREAWRTLGGIARHVAVGSALFAYHAGFVGLAALLAKKSKGTGAVLGAIALGLSPIVFVALSSMVEVDVGIGTLIALPFVAGSFLTLRSVGKRFDLPQPSLLAFAVLPALVAELAVSRSAPDSLARAALPFVGLVGGAFALRGKSRAAEVSSGYAAIALGLYAVVGGPTAAASGPLAGATVPLFFASLAAVIAWAVEREEVRRDHPRLGGTLAILALSTVLVAVLIACRESTSGPRLSLFADAATVLVGIAAFAVLSRRRPAAIHVAAILVPIAGFMIARGAVPATPQWWPFGCAAASALAIVVGRELDTHPRKVLAGYAVLGAIFALGCAPIMEGVARVPGHFVSTFASALVIAIAAHGSGGVARRGLHYLGGLAVVVGAFAWLLPIATDVPSTVARLGIAAAAGFAIAGFLFDARAAVLDDGDLSRARPFEDLSGLALTLAFVAMLWPLRAAPTFFLDRGALPVVTLRASALVAIVGIGFVLRSIRDRSSFPSLFGAAVLGLWLYLGAGSRSNATAALTLGALGLGAAIVAMARGTAEAGERVRARRLFGTIPFPFPAIGRRAAFEGFAHASWIATTLTLLACFGWLGRRIEPDRTFAIIAGACLIGIQIVGFFSGAFIGYGLRGSVTSLSLVVVTISMTAVLNRIGRPLPPPVVAYKLSAVAIGLWALAIGAKKVGPAVGRALGAEESGRSYHVVLHVVTFVMASVLLVDALLLSSGAIHVALSVIPPLLLLGPATVLALEARTLKTPALVHGAGPLVLFGAALIATQRGLLGSAPATVLVRETAWSRGLLGVAIAGLILACATLAMRDRSASRETSLWASIVALVVLVSSWLRVDPVPAISIFVSGALLGVAGKRKLGEVTLFAGVFLVIHAAAQTSGVVPMWAGPAIALLAGGAAIAAASKKPGAVDGLILSAIFASLVYALAEGSLTSPIAAGPAIFDGAATALQGPWPRPRALPVSAGIAGVALTITAFRAIAARVSVAAFLGALLLGLGATTGFVVLCPPTGFLVRMLGPGIALALALVAAIEQGVGSTLEIGRRPTFGARAARDLMLVLVIVCGVLFVVAGTPSPPKSALVMGFAAIVVAALTATVAAFRERSGRHVYYVQLAIVATYALVRTELATAVPPEGDALFGLCLGFLLLGVTVHARRAEIPEVASAVRTFVALLPLGIALVLPKRASDSAAIIAAASGALYGALAWLERSRVFGSLGAAACNIALLLFALSHGFDGKEVYLAAFGLFVLALGHLFAESMDHSTRIAIRVIGGLLLYAPAAIRLTAQLAGSSSGGYAIGFGAACLFGVLLGMVLQIRAYLAFGTGFLVLDVLANLTAAGIRDHRIGFLVLSLTGLSILGTMVFVTLQRDRVRSWGRILRVSLRGWD